MGISPLILILHTQSSVFGAYDKVLGFFPNHHQNIIYNKTEHTPQYLWLCITLFGNPLDSNIFYLLVLQVQVQIVYVKGQEWKSIPTSIGIQTSTMN